VDDEVDAVFDVDAVGVEMEGGGFEKVDDEVLVEFLGRGFGCLGFFEEVSEGGLERLDIGTDGLELEPSFVEGLAGCADGWCGEWEKVGRGCACFGEVRIFSLLACYCVFACLVAVNRGAQLSGVGNGFCKWIFHHENRRIGKLPPIQWFAPAGAATPSAADPAPMPLQSPKIAPRSL